MRDESAAVGESVVPLKEAWRLSGVHESRLRRFFLGALTGSAGALTVWLVVLLGRPLLVSAQTVHYATSPDVRNGERVYKGGCIARHGSEGKGAPMASTVFKRPDMAGTGRPDPAAHDRLAPFAPLSSARSEPSCNSGADLRQNLSQCHRWFPRQYAIKFAASEVRLVSEVPSSCFAGFFPSRRLCDGSPARSTTFEVSPAA